MGYSMSNADIFRKEFSGRLNKLLTRVGVPEAGAGRVTKAAEIFDVSITTAQKWLSGGTMPEPHRWPDICKRLDCSIEDLLMSDSQRSNVVPVGFTEIGLVDLVVKGGFETRRILVEAKPGSDPILSQDNLLIHRVATNMMEPYVMTGDYVIADRNNCSLRTNSVMLFMHLDELFVRRVQNLLNGKIVLLCENGRYQSETIEESQFSNADEQDNEGKVGVVGTIIGRVLILR